MDWLNTLNAFGAGLIGGAVGYLGGAAVDSSRR